MIVDYCPTSSFLFLFLLLLFWGVVLAWWYLARLAGEEQGEVDFGRSSARFVFCNLRRTQSLLCIEFYCVSRVSEGNLLFISLLCWLGDVCQTENNVSMGWWRRMNWVDLGLFVNNIFGSVSVEHSIRTVSLYPHAVFPPWGTSDRASLVT